MSKITAIKCRHCNFQARVDRREDGKVIGVHCATCNFSVEGENDVYKMLIDLRREWWDQTKVEFYTVQGEDHVIEIEDPSHRKSERETSSSKHNFYVEMSRPS